jgi:hypothetical protein
MRLRDDVISSFKEMRVIESVRRKESSDEEGVSEKPGKQ